MVHWFSIAFFLVTANVVAFADSSLPPRQSVDPAYSGRQQGLSAAFFDLDQTLRTTKSGNPWPLNENDIVILPEVSERLKALADEGYFIGVFSNQVNPSAEQGTAEVDRITRKSIEMIREQGGVVHYYDYATTRAEAKPATVMIDRLKEALRQKFGAQAQLDRASTFMVGDSAFAKTGWMRLPDIRPDGMLGRDHSNFDRLFAERAKVGFKEAKKFFGWDRFGFDRFRDEAGVESYLEAKKYFDQLREKAIVSEKRIAEMEQALETRMASIRGTGSSATDFLSSDSLDLARLDEVLGRHRELQTSLDSMIREEFDLLTEMILEHSRIATKGHETKEIKEAFEALDLGYKKYLEARVEYGGPKDFKRYAAVSGFFSKTEDLIDLLEKQAGSKRMRVGPMVQDPLLTLKACLARLGNRIRIWIASSGPALRMLIETFRTDTRPGRTGFSKAFYDFFRARAKASGIRLNVVEDEPRADDVASKKPRRIRILAPTHRDADLDAVALQAVDPRNSITIGALNLDNHPIFGAKNNPLMRPISNALKKHDNFIMAGDKSVDPIERLVELLKAGKAPDLMIYPEGQVSLGLQETRPVREKFSTELLARFIAEGIDFEVVPITFDNAVRALEWDSSIDKIQTQNGKVLRVQVHRPVSSESIKKLAEAGRIDAFNTLLRSIWLEALPTDERQIFGGLRWAEALRKADAKYLSPLESTCFGAYSRLLKSKER